MRNVTAVPISIAKLIDNHARLIEERDRLLAEKSELLTTCKEAFVALDSLIAERPMLAAKVSGSTTLGNIRAMLNSSIHKMTGSFMPFSHPTH